MSRGSLSVLDPKPSKWQPDGRALMEEDSGIERIELTIVSNFAVSNFAVSNFAVSNFAVSNFAVSNFAVSNFAISKKVINHLPKSTQWVP